MEIKITTLPPTTNLLPTLALTEKQKSLSDKDENIEIRLSTDYLSTQNNFTFKESLSNSTYSHDYAIVFALIGILGVLILSAFIISIVFHRKKKKLMASNVAKPQNRLRQQIEAEEKMNVESPLVPKQPPNFYMKNP